MDEHRLRVVGVGQGRAGSGDERIRTADAVERRALDVDRLYEVSQIHDVTPTEVVRRAIATEYKLVQAAQEGARVLIEWPRGRVLELDLNY